MKAVFSLCLALCLPLTLVGQAVATFPLINPNYNPHRGEKPIIPRSSQVSSKQPSDPNDYIGVDISKLSSSEKAKIESAFRRHTGEGFTGSKYDPNSPIFAYGPKKPAQAAKQDGSTAAQLHEISVVVENYKTRKISEATAVKFLEALGISSSEAAKILR